MKRDNARCKRPAAEGQKFCWQHSHGLLAKLRALTGNQTIGFCIGVASLAATLWFGIRSVLPKPSPQLPQSLPQSTTTPPSSPAESSRSSDSIQVVVRRHDLSERAGRENIRKPLSEFIAQGEGLQSKLFVPQLSDTDAGAAVRKWDKAVRQFLDEHMGTNYVTQFGNAEGITYEEPLDLPNSEPKRELWRSIYTRDFRLKQFLKALAGADP